MNKTPPTFHVFMAVQKTGRKSATPVFVYVGTPEEASLIGVNLQKKLDEEDKVRSKMQRKREIRIDCVEGQVGEKVLEKIVTAPTLIGVDPAHEGGDRATYADTRGGRIIESGNLYEHKENKDGE